MKAHLKSNSTAVRVSRGVQRRAVDPSKVLTNPTKPSKVRFEDTVTIAFCSDTFAPHIPKRSMMETPTGKLKKLSKVAHNPNYDLEMRRLRLTDTLGTGIERVVETLTKMWEKLSITTVVQNSDSSSHSSSTTATRTPDSGAAPNDLGQDNSDAATGQYA